MGGELYLFEIYSLSLQSFTEMLLNLRGRAAKGITVKRCPDWVYDWAYWRRKRIEKLKRRLYF